MMARIGSFVLPKMEIAGRAGPLSGTPLSGPTSPGPQPITGQQQPQPAPQPGGTINNPFTGGAQQ
jgi:hypothetical protein